MTTTANGANKRLVLHVRLRSGSLSTPTSVSLLANKFDDRSVLHGQVSLAALNQIYVFHEAMNGCTLQACFGTENIASRTISDTVGVYLLGVNCQPLCASMLTLCQS